MIDDRTVRDTELDKVLESVRGYALSPEGRDAITPSMLTADRDEIERRADRIGRYISYLGGDAPDSFPSISSIFEYASHTHADLDGPDIHRAGEFLSSYASMLSFIGEKERMDDALMALSGEILSSLDPDGEVYEDHPRLLPLIRKREEAKGERMRYSTAFMRGHRESMQQSEPLYRNERVVIPMRSDQRVEGVYVSGTSASGSTLFAEPFELVALNNEVVIAEERIRAEKARIRHELSAAVRDALPVMRTMLSEVIDFDYHYAFALWARRNDARHPLSGVTLSLKEARHPLLGSKAVPITIELGSGIRAVVLSGANAGGKTVTMKTVALLSLLYQMSGYIPASRDSVMPIFTSFYADIGDGQSILDAASTFSSHMKNIAAISRRADSGSLVILDELGSGTDPEEGSALSVAILRYLSRHAGLTFITSHYSAVKSLAYSEDAMLNASMEFDERSGMPTYRVLEGIPGDSHALATALRMNMPREIVDEASASLRGGDATSASIIKALLSKERTLDRKITALALQKRDEDRREGEIAEREKAVERREQELRRGGVKEIDDYLHQTRRELERLISDLKTGKLTKEKTKAARRFTEAIEQKKEEIAAMVGEEEEETSDETFVPGDEVFCGSAGTPGRVVSVDGSQLSVSLENGLRLTIRSSMARHRTRKKEEEKPSVSYGTSSKRAEYTMDLRGLTLEEALRRIDDQIEAALLSGLSSFSIIHGYGDGILQRGIHEYLKKRREVKDYSFARPEDGGMGKTYVTLSL